MMEVPHYFYVVIVENCNCTTPEEFVEYRSFVNSLVMPL